ncbi:MAG: glycine C-acetyltransferase [Acidobacteriota bacterium]
MYTDQVKTIYQAELDDIQAKGLYKKERLILSPQGARVDTPEGEAINLCANNYLGLADHPELIAAAQEALDRRGYGMASVRFICGTQDIHKELEERIARFFRTEGAILYASCFDANGGLFETLLGPDDVVISDALNHASIIDGVRLCKAQRKIYRHADMAELEERLRESSKMRIRLIASDGAFSMHGDLAPLPQICDLAERYDAMVMIDESHATGFIGATGRGTPEHFGVEGRIDIITSTLGKAVGGASGGFTTGRREIVDLLRQRSRPYLFSNSVAPPVVAASIKALELIERSRDLVEKLQENTRYFRQNMTDAGFRIQEGIHPIVPIMIGQEAPTVEMARKLNERGIFVVGFSYPVVPRGEARIRVQVSAAHTREQLDRAIQAFTEVGREVGLI